MGMRESRQKTRTKLVSFSGVDGAGKTTQIDALCSRLSSAGLQVRVFRFWDDVARLTRIREGTGHKVFRGDKGIGTPETPINRRDKNVRGWPITCLRLWLYLIDAISLRSVVRDSLRSGANFVIFDRYIYDELANLNLDQSLLRFYARFLMAMVPRPDVSFVLDADPEVARARKPEYPVEFIRINRRAYRDLCDVVGDLTLIPPMDMVDAKAEVLRHVLSCFKAGEPNLRQATTQLFDATQTGPGTL